MDFLHNLKKVTRSTSEKAKYFLEAKRNIKEVKIEYVNQSGRMSKRVILPKELYKNSRGTIYVQAYCNQAQESRTFLLNKITLVEVPEYNKSEVSAKPFAGRPVCSVTGCDNLAEIRNKTGKHNVYRKTCTTCRRKSATGPASKKKRPTLQHPTNRPICSVASCNNLAEIHSNNNGRAKYRKTCTKCRRTSTQSVNQLNSESFGNAKISSLTYEEPEKNTKKSEKLEMTNAKILATEEYDEAHMLTATDQLRRKLLDISRRNNLINFRQTDNNRRVLRVVDEVPSKLLEKLINSEMQFQPLPDIGEEPADEKTDEFNIALTAGMSTDEDYLSAIADADKTEDGQKLIDLALIILKDKIRAELGLKKIDREGPPKNIREYAIAHHFNPDFELPERQEGAEHDDKFIQTLLMPDELGRRLKATFSNKRDIERDKGLNTFHACFGFLQWTEAKNSEQTNVSPLVLLPIEIDKSQSGSGHKYKFSSKGAEPLVNQTLAEKLKSDFGLQLPDIYDPAEEAEFNLENYFAKVKKAISNKLDWKILRHVSFGFFNYLDIVIFNDLLPENWPSADALLGHELVARLLSGIPANEVAEITDTSDIDGLTIAGEIPNLVMPADSSQHSAIIHALEGRPLVIQGPPGTGKSQTISNLIAALAKGGKRVLFLAEKQPALDVVKKRLAGVGLQDIIFDPKVSGDKFEIYQSLERRLDPSNSVIPKSNDINFRNLKKTIIESNDYKKLIDQNTNYCDKPFFELIWISQGAANHLSKFELPYYLENPVEQITETDIESINELLKRFIPTVKQSTSTQIDLAGHENFSANPVQIQVLQRTAGKIIKIAEDILKTLSSFELPSTLNSIAHQMEFISSCKKIIEQGEQHSVNFILNDDSAEQKIQDSLNSHKKLEEMLESYSFLANISENEKEVLVAAATNLDSVLREDQGFISQSLPELDDQKNRLKQELIYAEEIFQEIRTLDIEFETLRFGTLWQISDVILEENEAWKEIIEALDNIRSNKITQDNAEHLRSIAQKAASLEAKIEGLPNTLSFVKIFETAEIHQLEQLQTDLKNIGFFGSFGSAAKTTKNELKRLGLNPDDKELTDRWLTRLIDCLNDALNLERTGELEPIFRDVDFYLYDNADFIRASSEAILSVLDLQDKLNSSLRNVITAEKTIKLCKWIISHNEMISASRANIAGTSSTETMPSFILNNKNQLQKVTDVVLAGQTLGFDECFKFPNSETTSFKEIFEDYFSNMEKCNLSAINTNNRETIQNVNNLLKQIERISNSARQPNSNWLLKILKPEKMPEIEFLSEEFVKLENEINRFGRDSNHRMYENFDASKSSLNVVGQVEYFSNFKNQKPADLIDLVARDKLRRETNESIDPTFFKLVSNLELGEQDFNIEDYKKLFVLRTAQSILNKVARELGEKLPQSVSLRLGDIRDKFSKLDRDISRVSADETLGFVLKTRLPRGIDYGPKRNFTEMGLIQNELSKKRRMAIRDLIRRATAALLALKPVWFLNPVAASQFLPRKSGMFDVIIIDEASQMLPEKAIASIARANNLVVVGDNKQMPPSNWMKSSIEFDDEEEEEVDAESILDLAEKRVGNSISLRWHYRSRHPSLIEFSNSKFYDHKLEIFPTPSGSKSNLGVKCVKVDGLYKGKVNQVEIQEVIIQAKELMERYPDESIGIVAINQPQMESIREVLESSNDNTIRDYLKRWDGDVLNELFVKNLENVQGDERDNIIISTVYAKDENGSLYQRFPSVVSEHGHRRLNVLVTRAKNRVILITSLNPSDIKIDERAQRGKKIFRDYIEYAMTGQLETGELLNKEAENDFELAVGKMIQDGGYEVTPQVGVRGFRIDLGVSHPNYPYGFIAGVECDGATFHSSASARDRDLIRQDILEGLGWKIYRVWSTDWFTDPEKERNKFFDWLSSIWSNTESPQSPPTIETPIIDDIEKQSDLNEMQVTRARPTGQKGLLEIDDKTIEYWKPVDGLYEYWDDGRLIGFTEEEEVEVAQANTSFANRMASTKVKYNTTIVHPNKSNGSHDRFEIALRWIFKNYSETK